MTKQNPNDEIRGRGRTACLFLCSRRLKALCIHQEFSRAADNALPLKRRARIHLVGLDMIVPKHTSIVIEILVRKFSREKMALGVFGIVAFDFRKYTAQRRG